MSTFRLICLAGLCLAIVSSDAAGEPSGPPDSGAIGDIDQEWGDPAASARTQAGAFAFSPTIALFNTGIDPNVFNSSTDPKRDMTATLEPNIDVWLRLGRSRIKASSRADLLYFKDYSSQRTVSAFNTLRLDVPFNRFRMFAGGGVITARDRPGPDIDLRARHQEYDVNGGVDVRVGSQTTLTVFGQRSSMSFEHDAIFQGSDLGQELNRATEQFTVGFQDALTSLTSLVVNVSAQRTNFATDIDRNNTIVRIMPGFTFKPLALLTGRVDVGILRVTPKNSASARFQGLDADIDLGYTLAGVTHFDVRVDRSVNYSFDPKSPYYLLSGARVSVVHRVNDRWEATVSGSRSDLAYPSSTLPVADPLVAAPPSRNLRVYAADAGIGCRLGRRLHVAVNLTHVQRLGAPGTNVDSFRATRVFSSIVYGGN